HRLVLNADAVGLLHLLLQPALRLRQQRVQRRAAADRRQHGNVHARHAQQADQRRIHIQQPATGRAAAEAAHGRPHPGAGRADPPPIAASRAIFAPGTPSKPINDGFIYNSPPRAAPPPKPPTAARTKGLPPPTRPATSPAPPSIEPSPASPASTAAPPPKPP